MIGDRNRLVEFWKPSGAVNEANEPLPDAWVPYKSKWAHIKGETGMGTIRAAASAGGVNTPLDRYSFRVNYDTSITIDMQVREKDGTRYNILSVRHDKVDRNWTDVVAETGGSNG
jgi:SPP1 family predicted phage head-tail adaptor